MKCINWDMKTGIEEEGQLKSGMLAFCTREERRAA